MEKQVFFCDLCGKIMNSQYQSLPMNSMDMFTGEGFGQEWITESGKELDICDDCCSLLAKARTMKMIKCQWNTDAMFGKRGYGRVKDGYSNGMATYYVNLLC